MFELGINSTIADSTGKSPAELVYGEALQTPLDMLLRAGEHVGAHQAASQVKILVQEARKHLEKAREYQKRVL